MVDFPCWPNLWGHKMPIALQSIHSYLVNAGKHLDPQPAIRGTDVPLAGKLFDLLSRVFDNSHSECEHDITFDAASDGQQANPCRTLMVNYLRTPSLSAGRGLAERLQAFTTQKSKLGLLFLLSGKSGRDQRIVLSRFPADSAILAEESSSGLTVAFLEKVFMKSATAYKAAVYDGTSLIGDFWHGKAGDKQVNDEALPISNYWIKDFLASDFRATSAQGTRRLAKLLVSATKKTKDMVVKRELVAVAQLARGLSGRATSISGICKSFNLSKLAREALLEECPNATVFEEKFRLSAAEFDLHVRVHAVELQSGAILMAPADEFPDVFERTVVNAKTGEERFTTQGVVVNERLKKGTI